MNRTEKDEMVAEIAEKLDKSSAIYLTDYSGINVEDISNIRREFRKAGVDYKVYKNTLFKRALEQSGKFDKLADHLVGMTGFVFASDDIVAPAKVIKKYNDDTSKMTLKACYLEENYYDGSKLKELADLPSKDELIAAIIGSIGNPISGVVGAIGAVARDLVGVIDAISKKDAA